MESLNETRDKIIAAWTQELDYHLRGAWRAGYDYVHVYEPISVSEGVGIGSVRFERRLYESNHADAMPAPEGYTHNRTYNVGAVDSLD